MEFTKRIVLDSIDPSYWNEVGGKAYDNLCQEYGIDPDGGDAWVTYQTELFHDYPESVTVTWESEADEDGEPVTPLEDAYGQWLVVSGDGIDYSEYYSGNSSDGAGIESIVLHAIADYDHGREWFENTGGYIVEDYELRTVIGKFPTRKAALKAIAAYEFADRMEGYYDEGFYAIRHGESVKRIYNAEDILRRAES